MVSTRGVKARFSEGERVLCYEPDPTKAKVLYDSKVLQIVPNKDGRGRKQLEYLIHFQGWNASWDRCVDEDLVLRDTEENRDLQKRLMENAQIKLKEKKKKRRLSDTIREIVQERDKQKDKSGSDTASQNDSTDDDDQHSLMSDTDSTSTTTTNTSGGKAVDGRRDSNTCLGTPRLVSLHSGGESDATPTPTCPIVDVVTNTSGDETYTKEFPIEIPVALKAVLERDHHLIKEKNKLLRLPSPPAALTLLEDYVVFFAARYLARSSERRRHETKLKDNAYLTLDLCKEVIDGIRICFDFHCATHLLYREELTQAAALTTAPPPAHLLQPRVTNGRCRVSESEVGKEDSRSKARDGKTKPLGPEESGSRRLTRSGARPGAAETVPATAAAVAAAPPAAAPAAAGESGRSSPATVSSVGSTNSSTTNNNNNNNTHSSLQQLQPRATTTLSIHTTTSSSTHPSLLPSLYPDLAHWTLLPLPHRTPGTATLLYGPTHLLRLFVKLPEILYRMNLPPEKRKIILKHIHLFLEYLDLHNQEFFSESHYISNNT